MEGHWPQVVASIDALCQILVTRFVSDLATKLLWPKTACNTVCVSSWLTKMENKLQKSPLEVYKLKSNDPRYQLCQVWYRTIFQVVVA